MSDETDFMSNFNKATEEHIISKSSFDKVKGKKKNEIIGSAISIGVKMLMGKTRNLKIIIALLFYLLISGISLNVYMLYKLITWIL